MVGGRGTDASDGESDEPLVRPLTGEGDLEDRASMSERANCILCLNEIMSGLRWRARSS